MNGIGRFIESARGVTAALHACGSSAAVLADNLRRMSAVVGLLDLDIEEEDPDDDG